MTVTDYAAAPITGEVYGDSGIEELAVDAWLSVNVELPPNLKLTWDDHRVLTMGPRGLFLSFEQGQNAPPMVFALKSDPTRDLAGDGEFGLHYLPDEPDGSVFPHALREFYRPVAELLDRIAGDSSRPRLARGVEVMTLLMAQIAKFGIVRAQEFDDEGQLVGLDADIAARLPSAWAAQVSAQSTP